MKKKTPPYGTSVHVFLPAATSPSGGTATVTMYIEIYQDGPGYATPYYSTKDSTPEPNTLSPPIVQAPATVNCYHKDGTHPNYYSDNFDIVVDCSNPSIQYPITVSVYATDQFNDPPDPPTSKNIPASRTKSHKKHKGKKPPKRAK